MTHIITTHGGPTATQLLTFSYKQGWFSSGNLMRPECGDKGQVDGILWSQGASCPCLTCLGLKSMCPSQSPLSYFLWGSNCSHIFHLPVCAIPEVPTRLVLIDSFLCIEGRGRGTGLGHPRRSLSTCTHMIFGHTPSKATGQSVFWVILSLRLAADPRFHLQRTHLPPPSHRAPSWSCVCFCLSEFSSSAM